MGFIEGAQKEALFGIRKNHGGPFGAVITKGNKVIASAHNEVLKTNDPTMHAEINAIRKATKKLKRFDLSDCVLYTSCEPCPMCFSAIHWARIKKVYYYAEQSDAKKAGFDDKLFYDVLKGKRKPEFKLVKVKMSRPLKEFDEWAKKSDKKIY